MRIESHLRCVLGPAQNPSSALTPAAATTATSSSTPIIVTAALTSSTHFVPLSMVVVGASNTARGAGDVQPVSAHRPSPRLQRKKRRLTEGEGKLKAR